MINASNLDMQIKINLMMNGNFSEHWCIIILYPWAF